MSWVTYIISLCPTRHRTWTYSGQSTISTSDSTAGECSSGWEPMGLLTLPPWIGQWHRWTILGSRTAQADLITRPSTDVTHTFCGQVDSPTKTEPRRAVSPGPTIQGTHGSPWGGREPGGFPAGQRPAQGQRRVPARLRDPVPPGSCPTAPQRASPPHCSLGDLPSRQLASCPHVSAFASLVSAPRTKGKFMLEQQIAPLGPLTGKKVV